METLEKNGLVYRIMTTALAPDNSYVILDMSGGIYFVPQDCYDQFAEGYLREFGNKDNHLTMALNFAITHALVFDIDIENSAVDNVNSYIANVAIPTIKDLFDTLPCLTILFAKRPHGGLHVYLPELKISNDDYEFMCSRLKSKFDAVVGNTSFTLDIPKNFNLALASKPGSGSYYRPFTVIFIENDKEFELKLVSATLYDMCRTEMEYSFKKKKANERTAFRLIVGKPYPLALQHIYSYMMPVVPFSLIKTQEIGYKTEIGRSRDDDGAVVQVATFGLSFNHQVQPRHVFKHKTVQTGGGNNCDCRFTYTFMKKNAFKMVEFESSLAPLVQWWKRLQVKQTAIKQDIFYKVNEQLRGTSDVFAESESPLKLVLEYDNGCFFLPVFYALCKVLNSPSDVIEALKHLLGSPTCLNLLDVLGEIDPAVITAASKTFTASTIAYCGSNMRETIGHVNEIFDFIFQQNHLQLGCCIDAEHCEHFINGVIERYFPIRGGASPRHKNLWDCVNHHWQMMVPNEDIKSLVGTINASLKRYWSRVNPRNYPIKQENLTTILQFASVNCLIDKSASGIAMDQNKWFLRTNCGVLDLLTGHVGNAVPEHYLSSKTILRFDDGWETRTQLQSALYDAQLAQLFDRLWTREFLDCYLTSLREDHIGDYFQTLKSVVMEHRLWSHSPEATQMLRFYIHVCKFMRFDFEEMYFLMHVVTGCLVATNYGKHIVIMQGEKDNGKSKFFEMMRTVLGDYAAPINSNTLCSSSKRETLPDIALTVFCCRLLIAEELGGGTVSENFIKILTGNSTVSARALYENNRIGIPTAKLMVSTNKPPGCTATEAFCERVLPFHFGAKFVKDPPESIVDQIERHVYQAKPDDAVVTQSVKGLFLHMYFLHMKRYDRSDGFLHYPPVPDSILRFKMTYLEITDVFVQFKIYADVQEIPNEMTSLSDLRSAVRQFLTCALKDKSAKDSDLIQRFQLEYGDRRRDIANTMDLSDSDDDDDSSSNDEDGDQPPAPKKPKTVITCYEGIAIKNLRRAKQR